MYKAWYNIGLERSLGVLRTGKGTDHNFISEFKTWCKKLKYRYICKGHVSFIQVWGTQIKWRKLSINVATSNIKYTVLVKYSQNLSYQIEII